MGFHGYSMGFYGLIRFNQPNTLKNHPFISAVWLAIPHAKSVDKSGDIIVPSALMEAPAPP